MSENLERESSNLNDLIGMVYPECEYEKASNLTFCDHCVSDMDKPTLVRLIYALSEENKKLKAEDDWGLIRCLDEAASGVIKRRCYE